MISIYVINTKFVDLDFNQELFTFGKIYGTINTTKNAKSSSTHVSKTPTEI